VTSDDEAARLARIKPNLTRRARILQLIRSFFIERDFLEIETPVRVPSVAPEQFIQPFASEGWQLSTSPELHMKRLLASGYDRLFQLSRCFRKGESGRRHNPEFTMLEWYRIDSSYQGMMDDTQQLVAYVCAGLGMGYSIPYLGSEVDITLPWPTTTVSGSFQRYAGWDPIACPEGDRFDIDLVTRVVPAFGLARPMILAGYPAPMAALARLNPQDSRVAERAEVFIAGLEIANAYTELNDPQEQRRRFEAEAALITQAGGDVALPTRFLDAVDRLPPCGGIALGVDRFVMLLCDVESIADVIAFPEDQA
jgi:elongation factor P--(R)-beta-lysine ligase